MEVYVPEQHLEPVGTVTCGTESSIALPRGKTRRASIPLFHDLQHGCSLGESKTAARTLNYSPKPFRTSVGPLVH